MYDNPYSHQQDPHDDAPDPCEVCGGNFEDVDCASLCDGCEGCPVSGGPCHSCDCDHTPAPEDYENRCGNCGGWEKQCLASPAACEAEGQRLRAWMFADCVTPKAE